MILITSRQSSKHLFPFSFGRSSPRLSSRFFIGHVDFGNPVNLTSRRRSSIGLIWPLSRGSIQPQRFSSHLATQPLAPTALLYPDHRTTVDDTSRITNATLVELVTEGKFGAAEYVRLQLEERGIAIDFHPIYEQAAIDSLRWGSPADRLENFTVWFSLVPEHHNSEQPYPFDDLRNVLFRSGAPAARLPTLLRFGIIAFSKGYLEPLYQEILVVLVRFGTPEVGAQFLEDTEKAAVHYTRTRNTGGIDGTSQRHRKIAIEVCCQAGWISQAIQIMQLPREFTIPPRTYSLLTDHVQDREALQTIERFRLRDLMRSGMSRLAQRPPHEPHMLAAPPCVYHRCINTIIDLLP